MKMVAKTEKLVVDTGMMRSLSVKRWRLPIETVLDYESLPMTRLGSLIM